MRASLRQGSFESSTIATVEAVLTQFSAPLDAAAAVRMSVTQPDNAMYDVTLNALGGGRYAVDQPLTQAGIYRFLVRAVGTSAEGWPFTREQALTAPVWQGGDLDPAGDPATRDLVRWLTGREEALCDVIDCLGEVALGQVHKSAKVGLGDGRRARACPSLPAALLRPRARPRQRCGWLTMSMSPWSVRGRLGPPRRLFWPNAGVG